MQEVCQTFSYVLDIQFLSRFHEWNSYGYLIVDCETSKQLEHEKIQMLLKALRRSFLRSNFKEYTILAIAFSFCKALLQRDLTWG